jgi:DNA-binding XRE family transcriptional regulator
LLLIRAQVDDLLARMERRRWRRHRRPVMIGIAWWTGIAAGVAGLVVAYSGFWLVAVGLGLLALICAAIVAKPRKAKKLTRYALAKAAGISQVYVRKLEEGRSDPTVGMLQRLAKALGVPVTELLG